MKIPLEDNAEDILAKAQRGWNRPGETDPRQLGLHPAALADIAAGRWYPRDPGPISGLVCFHTRWSDMIVNSYVVRDPATGEAAAFDTGADSTPMLAYPIRQIFITHIHADHIFDLDRLKEKTGATAWVSQREPIAGATPFADGRQFRIGQLTVDTRRTSGHARGGVTYVVTGLSRRLAFVGDALFAGSMGGALVDYGEALRTNRESIFTLPDDTVICPGHGPLTTVGEEKQHNPFFAGPTVGRAPAD